MKAGGAGEAAPRLQVLVTSRVRLGLRLERVLSLAPLDAEAATGLLLARVQAAGATLDPGDPALPGLVACLEGLPLAIEIAAGHVGMLGAAVLTRIQTPQTVGSSQAARTRIKRSKYRVAL